MRFYWHLRADLAPTYISLVTSALNRARVPFRTKVLSAAALYAVADSGVLYVRRRFIDATLPIVFDVHERLAHGLEPQVPMFTRPLAPGLALAEIRTTARARAIALPACRARTLCGVARRRYRGDRAAAIVAAFSERGLDPARPYLGPRSADYAIAR